MNGPRVDFKYGGPEDGYAVIAPNPDSLRAPETDTERPVDDVGRPGMIVVYVALAAMAVALGLAYWLVTR